MHSTASREKSSQSNCKDWFAIKENNKVESGFEFEFARPKSLQKSP